MASGARLGPAQSRGAFPFSRIRQSVADEQAARGDTALKDVESHVPQDELLLLSSLFPPGAATVGPDDFTAALRKLGKACGHALSAAEARQLGANGPPPFLTPPPPRPPWAICRLGPRLRTPERHPSTSEARRGGLRSPPHAAPTCGGKVGHLLAPAGAASTSSATASPTTSPRRCRATAACATRSRARRTSTRRC